MLLIRRTAYARAGLVGNPSDGYNGKTLALIVRNFRAEVTLYEWDRVEVVFSKNDQTCFDSVDELLAQMALDVAKTKEIAGDVTDAGSQR